MVVFGEQIGIISVYAPQVDLEDLQKNGFKRSYTGSILGDLEDIVREIPIGKKIFIWEDLNRHISKENKDYNEVRGGFGFGNKNDEGRSFLDFAITYDPIVIHTFFLEKRWSLDYIK